MHVNLIIIMESSECVFVVCGVLVCGVGGEYVSAGGACAAPGGEHALSKPTCSRMGTYGKHVFVLFKERFLQAKQRG